MISQVVGTLETEFVSEARPTHHMSKHNSAAWPQLCFESTSPGSFPLNHKRQVHTCSIVPSFSTHHRSPRLLWNRTFTGETLEFAALRTTPTRPRRDSSAPLSVTACGKNMKPKSSGYMVYCIDLPEPDLPE